MKIETDITPILFLNLCEGTVSVVLRTNAGDLVEEDHSDDETTSLSGLIADEIENMQPMKEYADKSEYNLKELKKCAKLLNDLIAVVEAMPDEDTIPNTTEWVP